MKRCEDRRKGSHAKRAFCKALCASLGVVLLSVGVVGGTYAWLIADTEPVVNTFTYGNIDLDLEETMTDEKGNPTDSDGDGILNTTNTGNTYEMMPGEEYLKDPSVTVKAGSEACWLFVRLEESGGAIIVKGDGTTTEYDFDDYLSYEVLEGDEGWTKLPLLDEDGEVVEGIYFRFVGEDTDNIDVTYSILKDNKISVLSTVDKNMLEALDGKGADVENATYPKLTITAYAVQYSGFEPELSEGAMEPTSEQVSAAAQRAWQAMVEQNALAP